MLIAELRSERAFEQSGGMSEQLGMFGGMSVAVYDIRCASCISDAAICTV